MQESPSVATPSVSPAVESNIKDTTHSTSHFAAIPLIANLDSSNSLYHHHSSDMIHRAIAPAREPFQAASASLHAEFSAYPHFHHPHHYEVYPTGSYYSIGIDDMNAVSQISDSRNLDFGGANERKHDLMLPKLSYQEAGLTMSISAQSYSSSTITSTISRENQMSTSVNNGKMAYAYSQESIDDDMELMRKQKFLERNRVAASKCREKKRKKIQELEVKSSTIFQQNRELHETIEMLRRETDCLKSKLLHFQNSCKCFSIPQ